MEKGEREEGKRSGVEEAPTSAPRSARGQTESNADKVNN